MGFLTISFASLLSQAQSRRKSFSLVDDNDDGAIVDNDDDNG